MILISLTRKCYVSKLVCHEIFLISAQELSFLKNGPRRYEKTPLIIFFLYLRPFSDDYLLNPCFPVGDTRSD